MKNPSEQAYFGSHSIPKEEVPSEQAYVGPHSKEKKGASESFNAADENNKQHELPPEQTDHINNKVAPISDNN